ncbi:hypothetical protein CC2G_004562 [Coprinopsis cinerea AmutBmut pab1-1]|nr:hypothetical protein CC2G_004562 [Coprinopsis cinerea AmutBmut pab1-1]
MSSDNIQSAQTRPGSAHPAIRNRNRNKSTPTRSSSSSPTRPRNRYCHEVTSPPICFYDIVTGNGAHFSKSEGWIDRCLFWMVTDLPDQEFPSGAIPMTTACELPLPLQER